MYTIEQTERILKDIQSLLDEYQDSNDRKEKENNPNLKKFVNSLRSACIAVGGIRYEIVSK